MGPSPQAADDHSVGLIGLGLMGEALAGGLLRRHRVIGWDTRASGRERLEHLGGEAAGSAREVIAEARVVVLSLPDGQTAAEVCEDLVSGRGRDPAVAGTLVVDTTTADPQWSVRTEQRLASTGVDYVDATVSGNAAQAVSGDVIFMLGGREGPTERARELLAPLGRAVYVLGGPGAGATAKLVVNHVLGVHRVVLAEALAVAEMADLPVDAMLEVLRDSAAASRAMDIWGGRMVDRSYRPAHSALGGTHGDLMLICEHAARVGASGVLAAAAAAALGDAVAEGLGDADNAAVMEVMLRRAGKRPPGGADQGSRNTR